MLDTDNSTDSNDLEEHGLVLAIQAAHLASLNSKNEKDSSEFSHNLTNLVKLKAANAGDKSSDLRSILRSDYNALFGTVLFLGLDQFSYSKSYKSTKDI